MTFSRINRYGAPPTAHRWAPLLVHAGGMTFDADAINVLCEHIEQVGFIHNGDAEIRRELLINIGMPDREAHILAQPGEPVGWEIPDGDKSYCWVSGDLPPGLAIEDGHIVGVCNVSGFWPVEIVVGPAIHYDALGSGGAPLEPGEWKPIDEPISTPVRAAAGIRLDELNPTELDDIIAQALAAKADKEVPDER